MHLLKLAPLALFALTAFAGDYKLVKSIPVGGDGGWDYLFADGPARKLYVSRGTHVIVIDMDSEKQVADIPDTPGVHGIAIDAKAGKGFISCGRSGNVAVFDTKTFKKTADVAAGKNPDYIFYDDGSDHVFAFNGGSKDASAINADSGKVDATIALGGKPEAGVSDGKGNVFVNVEDTSEIVQIDTAKMAVVRRIKLDGCEEPSGLAIDRAQGRLYAGCGNKVMAVVDTKAGTTLAKLPIGTGVDANGFDAGSSLAFASTGDGHITIAKETGPGKFEVVQTVDTQRGARTMTVDETTHKIYSCTAKFGQAPAPTADAPRPRPSMVPNSFTILVVAAE